MVQSTGKRHLSPNTSIITGSWTIWLLCAFGLDANAESLAIILLSKEPSVDVPTVFLLFRHKA